MCDSQIFTYCVTTWNDWSEDVAFHSNTKGERDDIQKEEVSSISGSSLSGQDTTNSQHANKTIMTRYLPSLNGCTVSNSLIRVNRLLKLLAIKEIAQQLLDLWNTCRSTH